MNNFQTVHKEKAAEFDIVFSYAHEIGLPGWDLSTEEMESYRKRIDSGDLVCFVACVQAYKCDVLLSTNYLGECCYDSVLQFVESSDYYGEMVEDAVQSARLKIKELAET